MLPGRLLCRHNDFWNQRFLFLLLGAVILFHVPASTPAQETLGIDPTGRSGDDRPELLTEKPLGAPPKLVFPPPPPPTKESEKLPLKAVFINKIIVAGSTAFSNKELSEVTAPYENRELTNENLEALRRALTILYINNGYINSGSVIPDQIVVDGVLTIQIIEGTLTHIEVEGNKWFGDPFLRDRLAHGAGPPVNIVPLQHQLQLLQQDTRIHRIKAELRPGVKPGESILNVRVEEKNPISFWLGFNNYQSASVGAERGLVTLAHENITGHGDILSFTYGRSEGLKPQIDTWYSLPLTSRDTNLLLRYRQNDFDVVKKPFEDLNIQSESEIYEITLRHPFYRSLNQEFSMALTGEHLRNKTFLLDEPFSFSPGAEEGESKVSALRFSQDWVYRTQQQVFSARSLFSFGIDTLDATISDSGLPDGDFISWVGQFQWARILKPSDIQLLFRLDAQLSNDPLLPLEQIAVGGRYSVRGYRENLLVRDKALITSLESRIPLLRNRRWADYLQVVPFTDFGTAYNEDLATPSPKEIWSIGLGLRWGFTLDHSPNELKLALEVYWGYALKDVDMKDEYDLQDDGIHFQFSLSGF
jgi:hemolysin activation/secretion protein